MNTAKSHDTGGGKASIEERIDPGGKAVAFCGTRGIPANYGGFETCVDEISARFVERGRDCVVFCRRSSSGEALESHEGRRLSYVSGSSRRSLDTFVSALQTGWHLLRHRREYGYIFWFNNANLPGILLTLLARIPFAVNTDGLEWRRAKWKKPFKLYYFLSSFVISRLCKTLISDSRALQDYYRKTFFRNTHFIPYGTPGAAPVAPAREREILDRYGIAPGRYFLQITRFEPENFPLAVARGFRDAKLAAAGYKFLLVGYQHDSPYSREIKEMSGKDGVLVSDAVYDPEIVATLRRNCYCYVHGNSVGGTNPALLEAMETTPRVLAKEGLFGREMLGETGVFFEPEDVAKALWATLGTPEQAEALRERVRSRYQWDAVAESYLVLTEGKRARYRVGRHEEEKADKGAVAAGSQ